MRAGTAARRRTLQFDKFMAKMTTLFNHALEKMGSGDKEIFKMLLPYTGFYELADLMEKIADDEEHLVDRTTVTEIFGGGRKRKRNSKKKKNKIGKKSRNQRGGAKCLAACKQSGRWAKSAACRGGHNCGSCQKYTGDPQDYLATMQEVHDDYGGGADNPADQLVTQEQWGDLREGRYYCLPPRTAYRQPTRAQLLGVEGADRAALANTMLAAKITGGHSYQKHEQLQALLAGLRADGDAARKNLLQKQTVAALALSSLQEEAEKKAAVEAARKATESLEAANNALLAAQELGLAQAKAAAQEQIDELKKGIEGRKERDWNARKVAGCAGGVAGLGFGAAIYYVGGLLGDVVISGGALVSGIFTLLANIPGIAWVFEAIAAQIDAFVVWAATAIGTVVGATLSVPLAIITAIVVSIITYAFWRKAIRKETKADDRAAATTALKVAGTTVGVGWVAIIMDWLEDSEAYKAERAFDKLRLEDAQLGKFWTTATEGQKADGGGVVTRERPAGGLLGGTKKERWFQQTNETMAEQVNAEARRRFDPNIAEKKAALSRAQAELDKATRDLQTVNAAKTKLLAAHADAVAKFNKDMQDRIDRKMSDSADKEHEVNMAHLRGAHASTIAGIVDRSDAQNKPGIIKRLLDLLPGRRPGGARSARTIVDGGGVGGGGSGGGSAGFGGGTRARRRRRRRRRRKHKTHRKRKKCHRRCMQRTKYRQRKGRKSRRKRTKRRGKSRKRNSRS